MYKDGKDACVRERLVISRIVRIMVEGYGSPETILGSVGIPVEFIEWDKPSERRKKRRL